VFGNDPKEAGLALEELRGVVGRSGLIEPGSHGVVLLSGGPDSVAMLAGLAGFLPDSPPVALHVNYGLRREADADQAVAAEVCDRLGIELVTSQAGPVQGNLQAWARQLRYSLADELRAERGLDWIAVGHTRTDVAETVIYRLAASPGRRALAAMKPKSGWTVRPLLELERHETRRLAAAAGLPFAYDRTNVDPSFARVRIRSEVLPVLREINPGVVANIASTRTELVEEGELLEDLAAASIDSAKQPGGEILASALGEAHPALWRLAIRQMAERKLGRTVAFSIRQADAARRLARTPEGGSIDLGGGASLAIESGLISVDPGGADRPEYRSVVLGIPGVVEWGGRRITAERVDLPLEPGRGDVATLDLDATGTSLTIRGWQTGDRLWPLGMEGTKNLQDLFTDRAVPRSSRHRIPVLWAGDQIAWVAGVAVAHPYRLRPETTAVVRITASPAPAA